jgi:hypothetical protein
MGLQDIFFLAKRYNKKPVSSEIIKAAAVPGINPSNGYK